MASRSGVLPSPFAPNVFTSKTPPRSGAGSNPSANASTAQPAAQRLVMPSPHSNIMIHRCFGPPGYNVESMRTNPPKPVALNDLLRQTTALHAELAAALNH